MKLPDTAHTTMPWRIHEFTDDFRVEDVWVFRTPGAGPDDFPVMLAAMRRSGGLDKQSGPTRFLLAARWRLGRILGWDKGSWDASLRDRLPADLRDAPRGADNANLPLKALYELPTEAARELSNRTVQTVMHLGWAPNDGGGHELRMAVLVKPNGRFGRIYMALIAPFRYLVVYPALTRSWEKAWQNRAI